MPLIVEPVQETQFSHPPEMEKWIGSTQQALTRIPVQGVLAHGARFLDDEYLGDGETLLRFNDHGFRAFCAKLGYRYEALSVLETPSLASQVLNDLVSQGPILDRLKNEEFVLDQEQNTIIGLVSASYVSYGNDAFLADIDGLLWDLSGGDGFKFQEAYGINTELTVRYISEKRLGTLKNSWGEGDDITQLGLEFKNSMVGTSSVRLSYFLHRLVCTNGMMVPAATATSRVFHSGDQRSFHLRLANCFREVHRKLEGMSTMLHQLGEIEFNSSRLAADSGLTERVFDIIPGAKQTLCDQYQEHLRYPKECPDAEKRQLKLAHDTRLLELIPDYYGREFSNGVFKSPYRKNASAFDFLNIFTEYANHCQPAQRLEIQGKAGALAKYIGENARKFSRKGEGQG